MNREKQRRFKQEEYYGWRADEAWAQQYTQVCRIACEDPEMFKVFKSMPVFKTILEHVPVELAQKYLLDVAGKNPKLLKKIKKFSIANDTIGNPDTAIIDNNFSFPISPTTMRYIKVLSDLKFLFGSLQNLNIVEIGAGYGGLCKIISLEENFKNYYDIDLDEPLMLAEKYCQTLGIENFYPIRISELEKLYDVEIDLVISNYAFSECNYETQDIYIEKVLSKAKRGYITHNTAAERAQRTRSIICNYENFRVFGEDLCKKKHKIFVWGEE